MKVKQLFSRRNISAQPLYAAIVASARQPALYGEQGAPDTVEGRIVMITLHLSLAIARLRQLGERAAAQQLVEHFFTDIEGNLRERGVSDVAIPKRMRAIEALYVHAMKLLDETSGIGGPALQEALRASLDGQAETTSSLADVAAWAGRNAASLARLEAGDILAGKGWTT